ncbi:MAG: hypothetical protein M1812_004848 [Candelaria pacifica]|nr:MAG: hypothetical protein M1812_004848 [Candelaria pacifica]
MPDKPLTIATYAAGASLAAITLVYVFGPTFFIDGESSTASSSTRKKGVVGLSNPANDCFINSILQALAGLGDLRIYLIRESHRRTLDAPTTHLPSPQNESEGNELDNWKSEGLQKGIVTLALKEVLDSLNERPIYKKTMSAGPFIVTLENAFRTRISRQQQDAQEFLQIVAERLGDEYHAGRKARKRAKEPGSVKEAGSRDSQGSSTAAGSANTKPPALGPHRSPSDKIKEPGELLKGARNDGEEEGSSKSDKEEEGFPLEGRIESQIECEHCHFKPKPSATTFVTLTLNVPQTGPTTLNSCFDGLFQTEHIDDFKCDKCRLEHALDVRIRELATAKVDDKPSLESHIHKIRKAIEVDPEKAPEGVPLPDMKLAPKRRIAKHMRLTAFPKVLAIHLSRSIFDPRSVSTKNAAKVSFPEKLPLGGILDRRQYKLLGVVTHKGSHNSGHYETFRRQNLYPPYSTPNAFSAGGAYSQPPSRNPSTTPSPQIPATKTTKDTQDNAPPSPEPSEVHSLFSSSNVSTPPSTTSSPPPSNFSPRPSHDSLFSTRPKSRTGPTSAPRPSQETNSSTTKAEKASPSKLTSSAYSMADMTRFKRKKKTGSDRWWRISDDKIKESSTSDVLGMQKEVYLLFYELDKGVR